MATYKLSQIADWRACHAHIPDGYEVQAVVEAVLDGWADPDLVRQTAVHDVHPSDREWIGEIIRDHDLHCSVRECVEALLAECRNRRGRTMSLAEFRALYKRTGPGFWSARTTDPGNEDSDHCVAWAGIHDQDHIELAGYRVQVRHPAHTRGEWVTISRT